MLTEASIFWAVVLILAALALFFAELLLPTGGLLGLLAAASLIVGIVMLFNQSTMTGLIGATLSLLALPVVLGLGLKILPHSPIFQALILHDHQDANSPLGRPDDCGGPPDIAAGDQGRTLTELHPVGTCLFGDRRVECLSSRGIIPPDTKIRVVTIDGMQTKVETIDT